MVTPETRRWGFALAWLCTLSSACAPASSGGTDGAREEGQAETAALDAVRSPDDVAALDAPDALDAAASEVLVADGASLADTPASADVAASDAPAGDSASAAAYPPGPYGTAVGAVLPNLAWQGYVNPAGVAISSTLPFVPTSMNDLRRDARRGYALVHVSELI